MPAANFTSPSQTDHTDLAIIGAGAAGLAAAIFAGEAAAEAKTRVSIVLIDGAKKPGAKILVSGGGRCNVTNAEVSHKDYFGGSPNIIRNVLRRFSHHDTIAWMKSLGVELKQEEPWGKLFPVTDSARTVLNALLGRVRELGVQTRFGWRVADLRAGTASGARWQIRAISGEIITADKVIVATGGKALPKSGSDGTGYEWLRRLGHTIIPPVPALAPLVLDERGVEGSPLSRHFAELSGITLNARLSLETSGRGEEVVFADSTLFTHFGLSGPAAMNISRHLARHRAGSANPQIVRMGFSLAQPGAPVSFPTLKEADTWLLEAARKSPRMGIANLLSRVVPERVAGVLTQDIRAAFIGDLTRDDRQRLAARLTESPLAVKGDRGFSFAEATAGGVSLDEIQWKTMQSRKAPGLHLCGEVLDVDGRIGGFNFQWAWSSGYIAGRAAVDAAVEDGAGGQAG